MHVLKGQRMTVASTIPIAPLVSVLEEQQGRNKACLWPHYLKRVSQKGLDELVRQE